ncbi:glycosyl hydrolase family 28 protein [Phocaeicola sartorii]|uniref:glycosyl hydrolase family 28 protein n=1 Tax=Phocaeicola sartorii TaxID=671267 RepID=UPI0034E3ED61
MSVLPFTGVQSKIVTAPVPKQMYYKYHNDDFTVSVRQVGEKEWTDLYEYKIRVDMDTNSEATMVQFDFSGEVEVRVQLNNGTLRQADIRPLSRGIRPDVKGNSLQFRLDKPQKLSIECNGDRLHNLHLFAHALETDVPEEKTPGVMYFAAGVHEPADAVTRMFRVPSNTTVYLAPGAVLKGALNCDSTENVRICGRGMIWEAGNGIAAHWVKNLTVEDITVVNPRYNTMTAAVAEDVTIRGLKSFSYQGWGDGLDFYCTKRVRVDDVFLRNSDDCVAIYSHRWNFYGNTDDIQVTNSTLWADIAHPINIGTHGNTQTEGEIIENILFRNIDVLEHDEDDRDYQGVMTVNAGDRNLIRHVTFDSIRVERIQEGQLFHLRVMDLPRYCTAPGRHVEHITFRNITYTGHHAHPSVIKGYSSEGMVRDVLFENIVINGKRVKRLEDLELSIGDFVDGIRLK